mgnify:CR=1 FL=1
MPTLQQLYTQVTQCSICEAHLPDAPKPILQVSPHARILIIGQAPGRITRERGRPWDDASGDRLRDWLQIDKHRFYHSGELGIVPMGFCYPGKGKSGDLPPRPECAPTWHQQLIDAMPELKLTLLIGRYAQDYYLGDKRTLTDRVKDYQPSSPFICLPHPSPRNGYWLIKNTWFEQRVLTRLRARVQQILSENQSN